MSYSYISQMISQRRYWEIWGSQDNVLSAIRRVCKEKRWRNIQPARATLREIRNMLSEVEQREYLPQLISFGVVNEQRAVNSTSYEVVEDKAEAFCVNRRIYL